jgi:hypothetical protein
MTSFVSGLGLRAMVPRGTGRPVDVKQLMSTSFSLIYKFNDSCGFVSFLKFDSSYHSEIWLGLVQLILHEAVLVPVSYKR